jgi:hypothetical protein
LPSITYLLFRVVRQTTAIDPALTVESRDIGQPDISGVHLRNGLIHAPSQDRFSPRLLIFFV